MPRMEAKQLGKRIEAAIVLSGRSRAEIAEEIEYSVDQLGRYIRGEQSPRGPVLDAIADATDQPKVFFTDQYEGLLAAAEQQLRKVVPSAESK